jgi:hypothetical protein
MEDGHKEDGRFSSSRLGRGGWLVVMLLLMLQLKQRGTRFMEPQQLGTH